MFDEIGLDLREGKTGMFFDDFEERGAGDLLGFVFRLSYLHVIIYTGKISGEIICNNTPVFLKIFCAFWGEESGGGSNLFNCGRENYSVFVLD